jgi:hypothetical protein
MASDVLARKGLLSERRREKTRLGPSAPTKRPLGQMVAKDVDTESLQAQIDMSMSFAHDLVTSWIKPTHLAQLRSSAVNATQILEEELRRPPRLGVGTSIPTAPPLAHEASKLKRRLGKNGAKNEGVVESQPQDPSKSDDEEHKGRPSKRKTKADPFRHEGSKKKRKAESEANPCPSIESVSQHSISLLKNSTLAELPKHSQGYLFYPSMQYSNWTLPDSSSGKARQRMGPGDQQSEGQRSATLVSSPPVRLPVQTTFSPSLTVPTVPSISDQSREASGALRILYLLSTHLPHSSLDPTSSGSGNNNPRNQSSPR